MRTAWRVRPKVVGQGALEAVALATASQCSTGVDWLRWFATSGCCWLVTSAFVALSAARSAGPSPAAGESSHRVHLSWPLLVAAVVLVLLAPLLDVTVPA